MTEAIEAIVDHFTRTVEDFFTIDEFRRLLAAGRPLRIKYGVDVTAPHLHIGHAVNLWLMRYLQDRRHRVVFLIGDFTTRVGDPTGRDSRRPVIPAAEIAANAAAFIEQARLVLRFDDPDLLEIRRNSEWYDRMSAADLLDLLSAITHARLVSRDLFQTRLQAGADLYLHELVYPILQGYDSVAVRSDLTIIGSDQLFNEMLGRFYQERLGQPPQVIITTRITPGIDGRAKQSKSLGNYIGLGHSPRDKFGRVMRLPDHLIVPYFSVYTDVPREQVQAIEARVAGEPMACKLALAEAIVARYHGAAVAAAERQWFVSTFSARQTPADLPEVTVEPGTYPALTLVARCAGGGQSRSALRRLIQQRAVAYNANIIEQPEQLVDVHNGDVIRIGKRTWFRLRLEPGAG